MPLFRILRTICFWKIFDVFLHFSAWLSSTTSLTFWIYKKFDIFFFLGKHGSIQFLVQIMPKYQLLFDFTGVIADNKSIFDYLEK